MLSLDDDTAQSVNKAQKVSQWKMKGLLTRWLIGHEWQKRAERSEIG